MEQNVEQIVEPVVETNENEPVTELATELAAKEPIPESQVTDGVQSTINPITEYHCSNCGVVYEETRTTVQGVSYCPKCWERHFRSDMIGNVDKLICICNGEIAKESVNETYLKWASRNWRAFRDTFAMTEEEITALEEQATEMGILLPADDDAQ